MNEKNTFFLLAEELTKLKSYNESMISLTVKEKDPLFGATRLHGYSALGKEIKKEPSNIIFNKKYSFLIEVSSNV